MPARPTPGDLSAASKRVRPVFDHLDALTDRQGLADCTAESPAYRLDDAARGLVVTCREPRAGAVVLRLQERYLDFVLAATDADGACQQRMSPDGTWQEGASLGDGWGLAVWGLGTAAAHSATAGQRARALAGFRIAAQRRSPTRRAMAFATLGANDLLRARPGEPAARTLLRDAAVALNTPPAARGWLWPEPRLRHANAAIAEALLVAGESLADKAVRGRGLELLAFLLRVEVRDKHLSVTPVAGRGPDDLGPAFDQRPMEVAAIADACATAYRISADPRWLTGINLAWRWFLGGNDIGIPMFDPVSGGGYDALQAGGRAEDQGAEATLAMLSTVQHARHVQELR